MRVFLKLLDGRTRDLELEGTDTIGAVRTKVAALTGVHPQHQRLILEAREPAAGGRRGSCS